MVTSVTIAQSGGDNTVTMHFADDQAIDADGDALTLSGVFGDRTTTELQSADGTSVTWLLPTAIDAAATWALSSADDIAFANGGITSPLTGEVDQASAAIVSVHAVLTTCTVTVDQTIDTQSDEAFEFISITDTLGAVPVIDWGVVGMTTVALVIGRAVVGAATYAILNPRGLIFTEAEILDTNLTGNLT